jgi:transcriptional regulator with XRE-family HTH domain
VDDTVVRWRREAGKRLAQERNKRGLSQRELARRCGWHGFIVSTLEAGGRPFTAKKLKRLAEALRIKPDAIATPEDVG